jgi:hypothetical protein
MENQAIEILQVSFNRSYQDFESFYSIIFRRYGVLCIATFKESFNGGSISQESFRVLNVDNIHRAVDSFSILEELHNAFRESGYLKIDTWIMSLNPIKA